jgi:hypothetical protein
VLHSRLEKLLGFAHAQGGQQQAALGFRAKHGRSFSID